MRSTTEQVEKLVTVLFIALLTSCNRAGTEPATPTVTEPTTSAATEHSPTDESVVRVAAVNTTISTGLLQYLVPDFEKRSGLRVEFVLSETVSEGKEGRGEEIFQVARNGGADLVIAHYGKSYVKPFVTEGFGEFPKLVFANQAAMIGPPGDPAKIADMKDAAEAMQKISASGAPFLVNNLDGIRYLSELIWHGAGRPDKAGWYIEGTEQKARAVRDAEKRGGYVIFGVQPFLHFKEKHDSTMEIMVWEDPLLQRPMATIVVNPDRVAGVNHRGARALQQFLLSAPIQAKVKSFRMPGTDRQFWWPCARANNPKELSLE